MKREHYSCERLEGPDESKGRVTWREKLSGGGVVNHTQGLVYTQLTARWTKYHGYSHYKRSVCLTSTSALSRAKLASVNKLRFLHMDPLMESQRHNDQVISSASLSLCHCLNTREKVAHWNCCGSSCCCSKTDAVKRAFPRKEECFSTMWVKHEHRLRREKYTKQTLWVGVQINNLPYPSDIWSSQIRIWYVWRYH